MWFNRFAWRFASGKSNFGTMLWTTIVIIASNVIIFKLVDYFAKEVQSRKSLVPSNQQRSREYASIVRSQSYTPSIAPYILHPLGGILAQVEAYHSADEREAGMTYKMLFFQLLNAFAACLSFLWTAQYKSAAGVFDVSWYIAGARATAGCWQRHFVATCTPSSETKRSKPSLSPSSHPIPFPQRPSQCHAHRA